MGDGGIVGWGCTLCKGTWAESFRGVACCLLPQECMLIASARADVKHLREWFMLLVVVHLTGTEPPGRSTSFCPCVEGVVCVDLAA